MRLVTPSSTHGTEKKSIATIGFLAALLLFATQSAHADTPQRFMLQGTILTPAGLPQEASNVDFTIEIRSPGTEDCLLYRETHSLNMTNSGGAFSLAIGSGVRSGAGFQQSSTLRQVFNNAAALRTGLECKNGADYDAAAGESRNVVVSFNDGSGPQTLTQVLNVQAVPYSLFAETASQIGDLLPVDILQTNILTRALSQSNLESVFYNQARVDELNDLLDGTSAKYLNTVGALSFGDTITMSGAGTSLVVNNGATFGGVISSSNTTASTSTTTGALVVNGGVGVAGAINSGSTVNAATSMRTPIIYGSSAASGSLTLESTSNATKGYVLLNPNGGNVGIGTATPDSKFNVSVLDTSTAAGNPVGQKIIYNFNPTTSAAGRMPISSQIESNYSGANSIGGQLGQYISVKGTGTSGSPLISNLWGQYASVTLDGGGSGIIVGNSTEANVSSSGSSSGTAVSGSTTVNGTGTATWAIGGEFTSTSNNNIAYTGSSYGIRGEVKNTKGRINDAYGSYITITKSTGTTNTAYGLYVGSIQATTPYSIYVSDVNAPSYFAGNVGIGTATPQAKLDVNGYMRLAKNAAQPVACSATNDGAIALTSQYTMCVCKGGSSAWVSTTNGTTACAW